MAQRIIFWLLEFSKRGIPVLHSRHARINYDKAEGELQRSCDRAKINGAAPPQSGKLSCLMGPAGPWELFFCFGVGAHFSRVSAKKKIVFFFSFSVVFLRFLVVISHLGG